MFSSFLLVLGLFLIIFDIIDRFSVEIIFLISIFNNILTFLDREPMKLFIRNALEIILLIKENVIILFSLYLLFACFGLHIFGGKLNNETILEYNGNTYSEFYKYSNFNDIPSSFLILFSLMIINNWNNQVNENINYFKNIIILG